MTQLVNALGEVDRFHKNCQLLFDDLIASIREKTLRDSITNLVGPEGGYWIGNANDSDHRRQFVFDHNGRIRFAFMLVKTKEEHIRDQSSGYKGVCSQLGVDMVFPLLLITGVFEPRDITRFRNDLNVRRNWLNCTILLRVPENIALLDPSFYCFGQPLTITSPDGTNSWWCEQSTFKIRRLIDIKDSQMIDEVADDLLRL